MDNPRQINFMDDTEAASRGWMAVERDSDGHLIAVCAYPDDAQFFADAAMRKNPTPCSQPAPRMAWTARGNGDADFNDRGLGRAYLYLRPI